MASKSVKPVKDDRSIFCTTLFLANFSLVKEDKCSIPEKSLELINSGDDYELCFTADEEKYEQILNISKELDIPITVIGKTTSSKELVLYDDKHKRIKLNSGYKHF